MQESRHRDEIRRIGVEIADFGSRITFATGSDGSGQPEQVRHVRFERPPTPDEVIDRLGGLYADLGAPMLRSVGVAVWGSVDSLRGMVIDARFGAEWTDYPFAQRLSERLGAPIYLISGVSAAACAETLVGAGVGRSPLLFVHLGRSVASSLVVNGQPLVGAAGREGRLGHWQTGVETPRCVCGSYGHLEPLVSAQSLVRLAIGAAADNDDALAAIHRVTGVRAEALTAPQVVTLAAGGIQPLRELVDHALLALSSALANLIVTIDPAMILIGGPLALADDRYYIWLREAVAVRLSGIADTPMIGPAKAEPRGALVGALTLQPR
ncbi:MAG TPA: ROK family protein [Ktedonobacterales bacterium]